MEEGGLGAEAPLMLRKFHGIKFFTIEFFSCWLISPPELITFLWMMSDYQGNLIQLTNSLTEVARIVT